MVACRRGCSEGGAPRAGRRSGGGRRRCGSVLRRIHLVVPQMDSRYGEEVIVGVGGASGFARIAGRRSAEEGNGGGSRRRGALGRETAVASALGSRRKWNGRKSEGGSGLCPREGVGTGVRSRLLGGEVGQRLAQRSGNVRAERRPMAFAALSDDPRRGDSGLGFHWARMIQRDTQ